MHTLRSLADCRAIIDSAKTAQRAVVIGASFIGLEVAAALRAANIEVHVVAPDKRPMERILGPQMGDFIRALHEENGVVFHLEDKASSIEGRDGELKAAKRSTRISSLPASACVRGSRLRSGGASLDRGVIVNAYLETSAPGIFAAGDIARWPDPHTGEKHPSRALGGCGTTGADGRAQHARRGARSTRRAVLLEPAL